MSALTPEVLLIAAGVIFVLAINQWAQIPRVEKAPQEQRKPKKFAQRPKPPADVALLLNSAG